MKEGYDHQIDCIYAAATALYVLGDYEEARARCENILRSKPGSRIASELHLASIESQPSAGPTITACTIAANNDPLEGDNAPTHNNDRDASLTKSIENLRMDHNIAEGKLRRRKISSAQPSRVHENLITGTGTRNVYSFCSKKDEIKEGDVSAGRRSWRRGRRRKNALARQLSARTA